LTELTELTEEKAGKLLDGINKIKMIGNNRELSSFTAEKANDESDNRSCIRYTEDYEPNAEWIFTLTSLIRLPRKPGKKNHVHDDDKYKK
jgi:hypothetical protein